MRIPAIDDLMNHIPDTRSKDCMKEVLSCFYSDNLRSAVVMLYATVVSDLYYKICDLVSLYNDAGANQIKIFVDNEWATRPKSPTWENEMAKMCYEKNKILTNDSYAHFCHLQDERNLCAHPVISVNNLYRPSFPAVQGLIMDMLTGIICKPSFISRDLVNAFTDDIEKASKLFPKSNELKSYISIKYLDKIDNEKEEYDLFRRLWIFVFKKLDDKSKDNRSANFSILCLLYERNQSSFDEAIKREADYFGNSVNFEDEECIRSFLVFANEYVSVLGLMQKDFQMKIKQKTNESIYLQAMAFCLAENPLDHSKTVDKRIGSSTAKYVLDYLSINVNRQEAIDFAVRLYGDSQYYDDADDYFENLIEPILGEMTECQLIQLVEYSNKNSQIYDRRKFSSSRWKIRSHIDRKNQGFDYGPYNNFNR